MNQEKEMKTSTSTNKTNTSKTTTGSAATSTNIGTDTGRWVREQRERFGWTRVELANRSGMSVATIRNIETGQAGAGPRAIEAVVTIIKATIESSADATVVDLRRGHQPDQQVQPEQPKQLEPQSNGSATQTQSQTDPNTLPLHKTPITLRGDITIPGSLVAYAVDNSLDLGGVMTLLRIARAAETRTADGEIDWEGLSKVIDDIFT
jgi:transcriptional regulator with XRE-family HTH domain